MAEKKVAHGVVALSSAAVMAIYGAGFARTRDAANRFAQQAAERRPYIPTANEAPPAPPIATPALEMTSPSATPSPASEAANLPRTQADGERTARDRVTSPPPSTRDADVDRDIVTAPKAAALEQDSPAAQVAAVPPPAPAAVPVAPPPVAPSAEPAVAAYKDGTYYGWGTSRHGDIQAEVVIEQGRITVARVEKCMTRWSCNWVSPIPPVILKKQGTTYDYVSGATESSDAFQGAIAEALSQAK